MISFYVHAFIGSVVLSSRPLENGKPCTAINGPAGKAERCSWQIDSDRSERLWARRYGRSRGDSHGTEWKTKKLQHTCSAHNISIITASVHTEPSPKSQFNCLYCTVFFFLLAPLMTKVKAASYYTHKDPQDVDDSPASLRFLLNFTQLTFQH